MDDVNTSIYIYIYVIQGPGFAAPHEGEGWGQTRPDGERGDTFSRFDSMILCSFLTTNR